MAQRRRPHGRRNVLVFLGSFLAHAVFFFIAAQEMQFYPTLPVQTPAVQVEIVPETIPPIIPPPPPPPPPKVQPTPAPKPPSPPPQPVQVPQPPKPTQQVAKPQATPKPNITPTAPIKATPNPTTAPAPKPSIQPSQLAPPIPAPQPGPPKSVPASSITHATVQTAPSHTLVLHKSEQPASALVPSVSIPGAVFASPQPPGGAPNSGTPGAATAQGGPGGGAYPGGRLPGFGAGLRGGALGCMNAGALHLSQEEQARCQEAYGVDTKYAPPMDRIDASKRAVIDQQAASEAAAQKYRDSMPTGAVTTPIPGQPHNGQKPGD